MSLNSTSKLKKNIEIFSKTTEFNFKKAQQPADDTSMKTEGQVGDKIGYDQDLYSKNKNFLFNGSSGKQNSERVRGQGGSDEGSREGSCRKRGVELYHDIIKSLNLRETTGRGPEPSSSGDADHRPVPVPKLLQEFD